MSCQVLVMDDEQLAAAWVVAPELGIMLIRRSYDSPEHRAEAIASLTALAA